MKKKRLNKGELKKVYNQRKNRLAEMQTNYESYLNLFERDLNTRILTKDQYEEKVTDFHNEMYALEFFVWDYELLKLRRSFLNQRRAAASWKPGDATIRAINDTPIGKSYRRAPHFKIAFLENNIAADQYKAFVKHCKNVPALPSGRKGFPLGDLDQYI